MFLSSHILTEVEALCDRVGILRAGRLVDQGTLAELKHLSARTVEVTFAGPPPQLPALAGVAVLEAGERSLRLELAGEIGPLLALLAQHREPSLEEIFLHHYDHDDSATRG